VDWRKWGDKEKVPKRAMAKEGESAGWGHTVGLLKRGTCRRKPCFFQASWSRERYDRGLGGKVEPFVRSNQLSDQAIGLGFRGEMGKYTLDVRMGLQGTMNMPTSSGGMRGVCKTSQLSTTKKKWWLKDVLASTS